MISRRDFLKLSAALLAAPLAAQWGRTTGATPPKDAPNILIVLFDTLSARHMSLYGYPRRTTPNLERLARISTVYHQHWAAGNFTTPGTASLLTGAYPWSHRAIHFYGKTLPAFDDNNLFSAFRGWQRETYTHNNLAMGLLHQYRRHIEHLVPPGALALYDDRLAAGLFARDYPVAFYSEERIRGYRTSIPTSLLLAYLSKGHYALRRKMLNETYAQNFPLGLPDNYNDQIFLLEDAIDWIIARSGHLPRPFLAYYHLWPPHEPSAPRAEFVGAFDDTPPGVPDKPLHIFRSNVPAQDIPRERTHYDEYLAYADAEFGRLLDALQANGRLEDTLVVLTSDHGQMFERGILGHITPVLYEPLLHIPLLIHHPGQQERIDIHTPTSAVDLLPALTRWNALPPLAYAEGQPLPQTTASPAGERPIFAVDAKENAKTAPLTTATFAVRLGDYKLIHYIGYPQADGVSELYDLRSDPEELRDLSRARPELVTALLQRLQSARKPPALP